MAERCHYDTLAFVLCADVGFFGVFFALFAAPPTVSKAQIGIPIAAKWTG